MIELIFFELQVYAGEKVILLICFLFYGFNSFNRITCFFHKITPVVLSFSLLDLNLEEDKIGYLRKYEAIECRYAFTAEGSIIDTAKHQPFKNHIPVKITEVERINDLFMFVTADAVNPYAMDYFDEFEKETTTYFIC